MKRTKRIVTGLLLTASLLSCQNTTDDPYNGSLFLEKVSQMTNTEDRETGETIRLNRSLKSPEGLQASLGSYSDKILLTWTPVKGAVEYGVYRSPELPGPYTLMEGKHCQESTYTDTLVQEGQTFFYKVRAFADDGSCGETSLPVWGRALGEIAQLKASDDDTTKIVLSWDPVPGAETYKIWMSSSLNGEYKQVLTQIRNTEINYYLTQALLSNVDYYFKIESFNSKNLSSGLSALTVMGRIMSANAPAPPKNVIVSQGGYKDRVVLSWPKTSFRHIINRSETGDPGSGEQIAKNIDNEFHDYTALPDVDYYYEIQAVNGDGEIGKRSDPKSGFRMGLVQNLKGECDKGSVSLHWSPVRGATGYLIRRIPMSDPENPVLLAAEGENQSTTTTSFTDTEAALNEVYNYEVMPVQKNAHPEAPEGPDEIGAVTAVKVWTVDKIKKFMVSENDRSENDKKDVTRGYIKITWTGAETAKQVVLCRKEGTLTNPNTGAFSLPKGDWTPIPLGDGPKGEYRDSDPKLKIAVRYFYKLTAEGPFGAIIETPVQSGYRSITNEELYGLYQMTDDVGQTGLKQPSASAMHTNDSRDGKIGGTFYLKGDAAGLSSAKMVSRTENFQWFWPIIFNGSGWAGEFYKPAECDDLNGTIPLKGWFPGSVKYNSIVVRGGKVKGGTATITQAGGTSETISYTHSDYGAKKDLYAHILKYK